MAKENDYNYGDEFSKYIVSCLDAAAISAHELKANSSASRYVNQAAGDVVAFLHNDSIFLECKRNGAVSQSTIENFRGHEYIISEKGVWNDPERIHVIPRRVINSYIHTIVNGDPKRKIEASGWSKLPRSKAPGIILDDKDLKKIRAGRTLKQYVEELRRS
jgi:hypothetical protein